MNYRKLFNEAVEVQLQLRTTIALLKFEKEVAAEANKTLDELSILPQEKADARASILERKCVDEVHEQVKLAFGLMKGNRSVEALDCLFRASVANRLLLALTSRGVLQIEDFAYIIEQTDESNLNIYLDTRIAPCMIQ